MLMNLKGDQQGKGLHTSPHLLPLLPWTFYLYAALEMMDIMNVQWSNEILSTYVQYVHIQMTSICMYIVLSIILNCYF